MLQILYFAEKQNAQEIEKIISYYKNKNIIFNFNIITNKNELKSINADSCLLFVPKSDYDAFVQKIVAKSVKMNSNTVVAPISSDTKNDVFELAYNNLISKKQALSIPIKNGIKEVAAKDILYFEIVGRVLFAKTKTEYFKTTLQMNEAIKLTEDFSFDSPYVSFLVNLDWVCKITSNSVILKNSDSIPLSQKKASKFKKKLALYLSNLS